jgi:hypothetical protein
MGVPEGKFGTFNAVPAHPNLKQMEFTFHSPRILAGIDVYNGGPTEASIAILSANAVTVLSTLRPGELRRIRTWWKDASSRVVLELKNADGLRFDNLAYFYP